MTEHNEMYRATILAGRKAVAGYRAIVAEFNLNENSTSEQITSAARAVVIGAYPSTTEDDLKGRVESGEVSRRQDAKTVRAGLVRVINENAPEAEETVKPVVLRVSLSGEGGGSTVVPDDHPLYADIVALLAGE